MLARDVQLWIRSVGEDREISGKSNRNVGREDDTECQALSSFHCLNRTHRLRAEHWYVIAGEALVTLDGREIRLQPGQAIDIPRTAWHRVANPGTVPMAFIEVQTGTYFGEDDIERSQDDFGRT